MRNISETLLAAARSLRGKPSVKARLHDHRLRWELLHWGDGASRWTDMVAQGTTIHRVRSDSSGHIQTALVSDPAVQAQWTSWTTRTSEGIANSDVGIGLNEDTLRLVYVKSGYEVRTMTSDNAGAGWSAPETVVGGLGGAPYVATTGGAVFVLTGGQVRLYTKLAGSWGLRSTLSGLTLGSPQGVAACYDAAAGAYRVAIAGDGRLYVAACEASTYAWDSPLQIAPGGTGAAAGASALRGPSVLQAGEGFILTWVDEFAGSGATWVQPVAARSADWVHFGEEVALNIWADTERRAALAYIPATRALYAANEACVCRATTYDAEDEAQNLGELPVLAYERRTDEGGSRLRVEVLNAGDAYAPLHPCIRPLATLILERGYVTEAGEERIALDPHYLLAATLTEGREGGRLILEAVDGWGLLALWRPGEPLTWTGKALSWLLAEVCARVGLGYADSGADSFGYAPAALTILPTQSGAEAARELLKLAGGVGRFREDGALYALELYGDDPLERAEIGAAGEVLHGAYGLRAYGGTSFRVYGQGVASASELGAESMELGLRLVRSHEDYRLTTAASAQALQNYLWTRGRISGRREMITVPLRPEVELWDIARLTVNPEIIPPSDCLRRVVGIAEEYDAARGRYVTRVELGGR